MCCLFLKRGLFSPATAQASDSAAARLFEMWKLLEFLQRLKDVLWFCEFLYDMIWYESLFLSPKKHVQVNEVKQCIYIWYTYRGKGPPTSNKGIGSILENSAMYNLSLMPPIQCQIRMYVVKCGSQDGGWMCSAPIIMIFSLTSCYEILELYFRQ